MENSSKYQTNLSNFNLNDNILYDQICDLAYKFGRTDRFLATIHLGRSNQKTENSPYFSFRDLNLRDFSGKLSIIEPQFGSIVYKGNLPQNELGQFFSKEGRVFVENNATHLSGPNLFVALDNSKTRKSSPEKLKIIENDLGDALEILKNTNRPEKGDPNSEGNFTLYLGVLKYASGHLNTLFNVYTYRERYSPETTTNILTNPEYLETREKLQKILIQYTRMFYQACIGDEFDEQLIPPDQVIDIVKSTSHLIQLTQYGKKKEHSFSVPELINPITTLLSAHEAALKLEGKPKTLIGIQSGGNESTIALQYAYEKIYGKKIPLILFPISVHSNKPPSVEQTVTSLKKLLKDNLNELLVNRDILMIDDNANTGETFNLLSSALENLGVKSHNVMVLLFDPGRLTYLFYNKQIPKLFPFINHPGITPLGVNDAWMPNNIQKKLATYHNNNLS